MHARGGLGIERLQPPVRVHAAVLVVERLPAPTDVRLGRRRELQVGQRRAQIETGPADDDRSSTAREDVVDRLVREPLKLADGHVVLDVEDADEPRRTARARP